MGPAETAPAATSALLTPHAWYFDVADALRITSFNAAAGVVLTLEGRFMNEDGQLVPFAITHTPNTDRTSASFTVPMGRGWLLNAQVRASSGTPRRGQCLAIVEVVRGLTSVQTSLGTLIHGFVTDTQRRGWPGSPIEMSTEGPGVLRSITGTDPAANVEISETVPTNARWRVHAIQFTLVTDANAANREVALTFDDGTTVFARVPSGFTHVASTTVVYASAHHLPRFTLAQDTTKNFPLPRIDLQGGFRINTVTTARQATDNYGAPQLLVEEWIED